MPEPVCIYCANGTHEVCIQTPCDCPCHSATPIQEYQFGLEVQ